ncbi:MAG: hypothetical protein GY713_05730 [Actinomycetia bacterium]|nr:hypothetical protein [Actinomycetes bacterium]
MAEGDETAERPDYRDPDGRYPCPRCGTPTDAELYGPCAGCSTQLRASQGGTARDVDIAEYEPKMNVTPNAVALKDD